ncbi:hypothetical protein Tco_0503410 [Tanacetum coccineum]
MDLLRSRLVEEPQHNLDYHESNGTEFKRAGNKSRSGLISHIWVPTGKTFASSTTKVESEPPNGSNADIPNQCESEQALNVSAGTLLSTDQASVFMAMTFDHNRSKLGIQDHSNEQSSSKLVPKVVPLAVKIATS